MLTPHFEKSLMNQHFTVTGMSCSHCERAITQALRTLDPQAQVQIERSANLVMVQSDFSRLALAQAITEEGYQVV